MYINRESETIFITDNHIFTGTRTGMLYAPFNPTALFYLASFPHIYSCDPVVVQNHIAYVTIRGDNSCGQDENRLEVYRLKEDYTSATEEYSFVIQAPLRVGN
ncbi:MAG: hypothetical protein GXO47_14415 [Chlorobi bacterium]|nr:hypothetical protein [Chlorobiota bacterium]